MTTDTPKTHNTQASTNDRRGQGGQRRGRGGRGPRHRERVKPEYEQKIINIRRVTRVMAGGRRFSFSVVLVIGDKKGKVGVGVGKATDTALAIQKAYNQAKRNLVRIGTNDEHSLRHEVEAKFNSARIILKPNSGKGLVAGSAVRAVLELGGVKNVTGRVLSRSKNKLNIARATIKALEPFLIPLVTETEKKKAEEKKSAGVSSETKTA